jgi:hypothetical protein
MLLPLIVFERSDFWTFAPIGNYWLLCVYEQFVDRCTFSGLFFTFAVRITVLGDKGAS